MIIHVSTIIITSNYAIDNNRHRCHRCYTALKFSPLANQGKHRVKRILHSSVRKRLSLAWPGPTLLEAGRENLL